MNHDNALKEYYDFIKDHTSLGFAAFFEQKLEEAYKKGVKHGKLRNPSVKMDKLTAELELLMRNIYTFGRNGLTVPQRKWNTIRDDFISKIDEYAGRSD